MNDYVRKLQRGAIQEAVKDLVEKRTMCGKLHKNAYTSAIDALCKMGIKISRDVLYKRVERERD